MNKAVRGVTELEPEKYAIVFENLNQIVFYDRKNELVNLIETATKLPPVSL